MSYCLRHEELDRREETARMAIAGLPKCLTRQIWEGKLAMIRDEREELLGEEGARR